MGIRERGGDLRLIHIESPTSEKLSEQLRNHVDPKVKMIITDELQAYPSAMMVAGIRGGQHETIKHRDHVYVRGEIYTNTVESAFSLFKRGLVGAFHKISLKHLQRYLNEFSFRFNNRKSADLFGMTVRRLALVGNLPYAKLVEETIFVSSSRIAIGAWCLESRMSSENYGPERQYRDCSNSFRHRGFNEVPC